MANSTPPPISVITAFYNVEAFLPETINSVLKQSVANFEYFLVDDASSDGSGDIARKFEQIDPRIILKNNGTNKGPGLSRNIAIENCTSEYIALVDGDDVWQPTFLEQMHKFLVSSGEQVAGVFCWSDIIDEQGELIAAHNPAPGSYDLLKMFLGLCPPGNGSCLMIRKSSFDEVGGFLDLKTGEDAEMWFRILARSKRKLFMCNPVSLTRRRTRSGSLMTQLHSERIDSWEYCLQQYLPYLSPNKKWEVYYAFAEFSRHMDNQAYSWGRTLAARAIRSVPFQRIADVRIQKAFFIWLVGWGFYFRFRKMIKATLGAIVSPFSNRFRRF